MAKVSQKKLDEFLAQTKKDLSGERTGTQVRQTDVDDFLKAFRSDLEASYTQEERDQMKAARAASLRPGETRRSGRSSETTGTVQKRREDSASSLPSSSRGETNRDSGKRWRSDLNTTPAPKRTTEDMRADIENLDKKIRDIEIDYQISDNPGQILGYTDASLSRREELSKEMSRLRDARERRKQEYSAAKTAEYDNLMTAEDFMDNSGYRSTRTDTSSGVHRPITAQSGIQSGVTGYRDWIYEYINKNPDISQAVRENRMNELETANGASTQGYDLSFLEQMHDDEIAKYNYLYSTQGKEAAQEYLDFIQSDPYYRDGSLNKRQREETEQKYSDFAEKHPVWSSAVSFAQIPANTMAYAGQAINAALTGGELDPNASYNRSVYTKSAIRDSVSKQIENRWGKKGSFAYTIGMSMADFLATHALTGGVGTSFVLGSVSAAETTLQALDRGVDGNRALALGAVAGAAEYFTEKFSVEQLFNRSWDESTLKYIVKNVLSEAGEEFSSSLVNAVADVLISADKSEWQQMVNAYIEQGFSEKQAFDMTFFEHMKMLGLDALGGAISGGLMAGGGAAVGAIGVGAMNRENIRSEQELVRAAVNEQRREIRASVADPDTFIPERETFETGAEVRRDQLMTLDEEDLANRIEAAEDETEATAIKYGATDKQLKQVRELSDITGREVVFFRQKSENGKVRNGYYNPNDGRIYVNVNASRSKTTPMVVAHEITHTLKKTEAYRDLNSLVMADIRRSGRDPEQMREDKRKMYAQAGVTLADEGAIDSEIVAEEAERFLGNVRAIAEVFREKPSLGRTIASALDRMLIRATGTSEEMYISRAARLYERAEELADSAETEINRRLDEQEAVQATGGESAPQTGSPVQRTAPQEQPAEAAASGTAIPASEEQRKPSETVGQRQTAPQTGGTVSGRAETRATETEAQEGVRTSMDESDTADRMLEELNRRYENGEISDEEYDEAYELIEEARLTGRGIESSADVVDNVEGKIPRGIRKLGGKLGIRPKGEQYSISEDDVRERVANGRPVEAADEVQWSVSEEEKAQPTENSMLVDRYAGMEGQNNVFRNLLMRQNQRMVDAIVAHRGQTKTEKFREWFGKSTVINNDGEPMVVFRGTTMTDSVLDHNDKPIWFSNNMGYAAQYSNHVGRTDMFRRSSKIFGGAEKKIIPAYIRAVNPADFGNTDRNFEDILPAISQKLGISEEELRNVWLKTGMQELAWETVHTAEMKNLLSSYGYDSIKAIEFGADTWGVFDSRQVKSAVANNGKFNPEKTDIRYSISEDEPTTPYSELPVKAQTRVRELEGAFGRAMDKMFGLGMTYKSPDFRQFLADNVRPLVNTYLENGSIPQEESDALFRSFYNPLSGTDEDLQRQEFYSAFEQMEEGLREVARYAASGQQQADSAAEEPSPLPTTEEAEELFRAQHDARREMDKVMYKLMLRPEDEVKVGELLRGTTSADQIDPETHNKQSILEAYRVQKAFNEADAAVRVYKKRLKAELYKHVDTYLGNIADWRDKKTPFLYHRETPERNIRDIIPDKAEADAFIAEFISPVHHAEAERQRFIGKYQDRIAKLNISDKQPGKKEYAAGKRSEAYAVQFIGEAEENIRILSLSGKRDQKRDGRTLEEWKHGIEAFWAANPDMDRAKIENAVKEFRQIYNELLPKINEVRIRNGHAPVPVRQGYFPHFSDTSEDTLMARLLRPFGIQFGTDVLPTTINGRTANFRPGISYFQFGNQRLGFNTTYDALQGFSMYLNAASNVIYHTDNIQKLRALANRIRYLTSDEGIRQQLDKIENDDSLDEAEKQERRENVTKDGRYLMSNFVVWTDEYTNILANKKSRFDRSVEELAGRNFYNFMKAVENRVAGNMIAGNLGSALTNIIPLNQAAAMLSGGNWLSSFVTAKGERKLLQAMWLTLTERGTGFASMSDFLTNRRGTTPLVRTNSQKFGDKISKPMEIIDNFVSETIVRAFYRENLADGMSEELALRHADAMAASIMADRSKGALPTLFHARNPLMKLFTQFQVEVNNDYSVIFKDIPELAKANAETKAGVVSRIAVLMLRYFIGAKIFNDLFEKLFGRRPALDPAELINDAVGGFTGYQMPNTLDLLGEALTGDLGAEDFATERKEAGQVIGDFRTGALENLPFIGGLAGGGRLSIQSAFPDAEALESVLNGNQTWGRRRMTLYEELSKPAAYLLPPVGGGQLRNMLNGIIADVRGGVYDIKSGAEGGEYMKYPIYDDPWSMFSSAVFGPIHTEGGMEWIGSGYKNLSVNQTAAYELMKQFGVDDRAAFDFIQEYRSVPAGEGRTTAQRDVIRNAEISGEGKFAAYFALGSSEEQQKLMDNIEAEEPSSNLGEAANVLMDIADIKADKQGGQTSRICDVLAQSGLDEESKKLIFREKISDQKDDDIAAAAWVGITFDEYLDAHAVSSELRANDALSNAERALEFARYVDGMPLTETQKETMQDLFKFYSQIPVQAKNYNELRDIGISDDYAAKLVRAVDALEPLPGEKSVSSIQKARVVVDTISDADDRLAALGTVLSDSQFRKVSVAADAGLDPEVWVAFREILPEFDSDANGSYTQEEMEDAIRAFSNGSNYGTTLMKAARNLSRDEMAILWQIGGSWKSSNNPFSKTTGKYVKDLLDAEKKG